MLNSYVSPGGNSLLSPVDGFGNTMHANSPLESFGNMHANSPTNLSHTRHRSYFDFDTISNVDEYYPFRQPDLHSTETGNFPTYGHNSLFPHDELPPDPYYLPHFRSNDHLLSRSLQPTYSSFPQMSIFSSFFLVDNHSLFEDASQSPFSLRSRPMSGSDPDLCEPIPFKWTSPATSPLKQNTPSNTAKYQSPQRQRRLTSSRTRGGSPGSPDTSNELRIEDVISGKDKRTTLMIKNIPNAYRFLLPFT